MYGCVLLSVCLELPLLIALLARHTHPMEIGLDVLLLLFVACASDEAIVTSSDTLQSRATTAG